MRRNEDDDWQPGGARIPALPVRAVGLAPASCTGAICPPSRVSARRRTRHSDYLSVSRTILSSNLETRYAARCGAHGLFPRGACCIYSAHPCTDCVQVRRVQGMALRVNEELASQACQQSPLCFLSHSFPLALHRSLRESQFPHAHALRASCLRCHERDVCGSVPCFCRRFKNTSMPISLVVRRTECSHRRS